METLKYPVGRFNFPAEFTTEEINQWIADIASFPSLLKAEISNLSAEQLEWKYRPNGWSIRQVVHHCADSHINSQMRFKLALTEAKPTIKPYEEHLWAELPDMQSPIEWSLDLLDNLHKRWTVLLESLSQEDLMKEYVHPEHGKVFNLGQTISMYSWHCRHHLAHVKQAKEAQGKH
ncbi:MAG: putative metal-dependent hydrolase [Cyclobacteriaceae bacterium]